MRPRTHRRRDDAGAAMILTLMVMALVTALATTVSVVTVNNLQSSTRARQAGSALNAADAGLAQAMAHMETPSAVRGLRCSPTCGATNPWGSETGPVQVSVPGKAGQSYSVWIEAVAPFPENDPGRYRIHSTGRAAGSASRMVTMDVGVTSSDVPRGVFARSVQGGGNASVSRESIFSTGCVYKRSKISMVPGQIDVAYGIPVGVHSSQTITDAQGSTPNCSSSNSDIHRTSACNTAYPYDHDRLGGSLLGTPCAGVQTTYPDYYGPKNLDSDVANEVNGSYIADDTTLRKLFGLGTGALRPDQIDRLRAIALSQGNHWTSSTGWTSPNESSAVMFFDLTSADPGSTVDLNGITGFSRAGNLSDSNPACESKSLTIVIVDGNAKLNSNQQLTASLFLTSDLYGDVIKANGTSNFIGTIYANNLDLSGTANLSMDTCFLANASAALLDLAPSEYRELDR